MIKQKLFANFAHPRGLLGAVAGRIMAAKSDNNARSEWALAQLDPAPDARVLEVGYGPGVSLADTCGRVTRGHIVGVDISAVMRKQAARRNAAHIRAGLLELRVGDAQHLDADLRDFDLVYGINVWQFWPDAETTVRELRARLAPVGRLALVYMRPPTATTTSDEAAVRLQKQFADAGFGAVESRSMDGQSPAVIVIGTEE
jgi:SAM-dependent methyltransferase